MIFKTKTTQTMNTACALCGGPFAAPPRLRAHGEIKPANYHGVEAGLVAYDCDDSKSIRLQEH